MEGQIMTLKVLIGCEESQEVCKAFRALGHDAYSCDLLLCSGGRPEWHLQIDVFDAIKIQKWDLVIAHPPCDYLANSGVRWRVERKEWDEINKASAFFNRFVLYGKSGNAICIENPIQHSYAREHIVKYNQIVQPWMFGHTTTKATCLWLYGLPELRPTDIIPKQQRTHEIHTCPPGPDRKRIRSKTFPGIAAAMAKQWSEYILNQQTKLEL